MSDGTTLHDPQGDPKGRESIHPQVLPFFPDYKYWEPSGDRNVLCDMRNPKNAVGHQQRAFTVYWALKCCGPLDLGIDIGSARGLTPHCVHVDLYGTGAPHPFYGGGPYRTDVVRDGADLLSVFPKDTFPFLSSNHSLEHFGAERHGGGDGGVVKMLADWVSILRVGGTLAMIVPDNDHFDVMKSDKDHKHAWGHSDFRRRVLDQAVAVSNAEVVEYDTLNNHFSFNVVLRRK